jgi:hypothetical protein
MPIGYVKIESQQGWGSPTSWSTKGYDVIWSANFPLNDSWETTISPSVGLYNYKATFYRPSLGWVSAPSYVKIVKGKSDIEILNGTIHYGDTINFEMHAQYFTERINYCTLVVTTTGGTVIYSSNISPDTTELLDAYYSKNLNSTLISNVSGATRKVKFIMTSLDTDDTGTPIEIESENITLTVIGEA